MYRYNPGTATTHHVGNLNAACGESEAGSDNTGGECAISQGKSHVPFVEGGLAYVLKRHLRLRP